MGGGAATLLLFLLVRRDLIDDAYITLTYARNLALHLQWGLIPHHISNTQTSPLYVFLLAVITAGTRVAGSTHPFLALGIISVALGVVIAWAWTKIARSLRLPVAAAVVGVLLAIANPLLLSALGLEVLLTVTLLVVLVAFALEGRAGSFGVVAGLAVLDRLDLLIFVIALALATTEVRRQWLRVSAITAVLAIPWFLFSWLYFGSAVPDSLLIKEATPSFTGAGTFFTGPAMYWSKYPAAVTFAFFPAALGALALAAWFGVRRSARLATALPYHITPAVGLAAGGIAYYAVFSVIDPGPFHWYYVPTTASLTTFLVIVAGVAAGRASNADPRARALWSLPAVVVGTLTLATVAAELGHGVPWRTPMVTTNSGTAAQYTRIGAAVRKRIGGAAVLSPGEIGTLAYSCQCLIADSYSDRGYVIELVDDRIAHYGTAKRALLRLNYLWLNRGEKPIPLAYKLWWGNGPGSGPNVWQVSSPWDGVHHLTLTPIRRSATGVSSGS